MTRDFLRLRVFCEERTFVAVTAGRERFCAFAPGGRTSFFCPPYAKSVIVELSSATQKRTIYYSLPCPGAYEFRIAVLAPPAAKRTFSLTDLTYGLPIDGVLTFRKQ